ncbi:hypothetical protein V0U79_01475 [Hyphobacterium sp. HN65]|uniref:Uncharacterized protein n=1 Tax=Hyphobacterium lacteum TaxID=3116575 RepID=A0ABU7LM58_9PROT|nr:hypothetical protein [Hyphobacterium sp. HN65]MEE2525018.1 hypothetical protein [Hyphobacterium sp. HN65]
MKRFLLAFSICSLFAVTPAFASGGGGGGSGDNSANSNRIAIDWNQDEGSAQAEYESAVAALGVDEGNPRVVVMPAIVVPLVVDDRLQGYAYLHSRLLVAEGESTRDVIEHTHFALDRLIRASHRTNLTAESGDTVDIDLTTQVWMDTLAEYFGEGVIQRLAIMTPDTRLLR